MMIDDTSLHLIPGLYRIIHWVDNDWSLSPSPLILTASFFKSPISLPLSNCLSLSLLRSCPILSLFCIILLLHINPSCSLFFLSCPPFYSSLPQFLRRRPLSLSLHLSSSLFPSIFFNFTFLWRRTIYRHRKRGIRVSGVQKTNVGLQEEEEERNFF